MSGCLCSAAGWWRMMMITACEQNIMKILPLLSFSFQWKTFSLTARKCLHPFYLSPAGHQPASSSAPFTDLGFSLTWYRLYSPFLVFHYVKVPGTYFFSTYLRFQKSWASTKSDLKHCRQLTGQTGTVVTRLSDATGCCTESLSHNLLLPGYGTLIQKKYER